MNSKPHFSKETLLFLKKASRQKNSLWLDQNEEKYKEVIKAPLTALAEMLSLKLKSKAIDYHFPKRGLGRLKRASHRVSENGGGLFKNFFSYSASVPNPSRFEKNPSLFFMVDSEDTEGDEVLLAGGLYMPSSRQLKTIRERIAENPTPFEALFKDKQFQSSFKNGFSEERKSTRMPRGFDKDHPAKNWLMLQGFYVWKSYPEKIYSKNSFFEQVVKDAEQILRLNQLLDQAISGQWPSSFFQSSLKSEENRDGSPLNSVLKNTSLKLYKPDF